MKTDRIPILSRLPRVEKKAILAGAMALMFFFSVIAVINSDMLNPAKAATVSGRIYAEAAVGWYQGYASWSTGTAYIYTSQAPSPPGTYNDQFDMRFDIAGTIGSGATISDITVYVSKGGQGTISSGALSVDALNPFSWTWGGTATWETYGISSISTSGTDSAYRALSSAGITSEAQDDYSVDGHFYIAITKGTAVQSNAYANLGMNATDDYPTNGPPYVVVTYTGVPSTWMPTIDTTPPVGTHAVINSTIVTHHWDNYTTTTWAYGGMNNVSTADDYLETFNTYDANGGSTILDATASYSPPTVVPSTIPVFRWNLTGVPTNATIEHASLHVYKYSIQDDAMTYRVYEDNPLDWKESTFSYYQYNLYQGKTANYTTISLPHGTGWANGNLSSTGLTTIVNHQFKTFGKAYLSMWGWTASAHNIFYSKEYSSGTYAPYLLLRWSQNWQTLHVVQLDDTYSYTYDYVYTVGDSYDYTAWANESNTTGVSWASYGYPALGLTVNVVGPGDGFQIHGTITTAGNFTIGLNCTSDAGTLTAYGNYTIEVWGTTRGFWPPTIESTPATSVAVGAMYNYTLTTNASETFTWGVVTNATWLSNESNTHSVFGIPTIADIGYYDVKVTIHGDLGLMNAWQNWTITVGFVPWSPYVTTSPTTYLQNHTHYVFVVHWNETVGTTSFAGTATGWLTFTQANMTLWGVSPSGNHTYTVYLTATSVNGTGLGNKSYSIQVVWIVHIPPSEMDKGIKWLSESGFMFFLGAIGLLGAIATPALFIKYRDTAKSSFVSTIEFIVMEIVFIALFWASLVPWGY